jgi:hypothetical protein
MRTRLALIMTVLWVAIQMTTAAQTCAGWQSSAAARMACCKASAHACPHEGQNAADRCCAQGEEGRQRFTASASTYLAKPAPAVVPVLDMLLPSSFASPRFVAARSYDSSTLATPHASPHVLFSVFRI